MEFREAVCGPNRQAAALDAPKNYRPGPSRCKYRQTTNAWPQQWSGDHAFAVFKAARLGRDVIRWVV